MAKKEKDKRKPRNKLQQYLDHAGELQGREEEEDDEEQVPDHEVVDVPRETGELEPQQEAHRGARRPDVVQAHAHLGVPEEKSRAEACVRVCVCALVGGWLGGWVGGYQRGSTLSQNGLPVAEWSIGRRMLRVNSSMVWVLQVVRGFDRVAPRIATACYPHPPLEETFRVEIPCTSQKQNKKSDENSLLTCVLQPCAILAPQTKKTLPQQRQR